MHLKGNNDNQCAYLMGLYDVISRETSNLMCQELTIHNWAYVSTIMKILSFKKVFCNINS